MEMTAWQRHVHFIQTNQKFYGGRKASGGIEEQPNPTVRTDQDILRENYRCHDRRAPLRCMSQTGSGKAGCTVPVA